MADTLDVIDLPEVKHALNIDAAVITYDAKLAQVITAASRMCDDVFGPVVRRTVTDELHDGGCGSIWLRQTPVVSVTSVTEHDHTTATVLTAETNASKPADGYLLVADGHYVRLFRRSTGSDARFPVGRRNIVVTYVAGRAADTASVDERFKEAAAVCAIHLWQHRGSGSGAALQGGEGPFFGAVPFSSDLLRKKLRAMYPADARPPDVR